MPAQQYCWWGFGGNEPPAHLKTKKQLSELKLAPKEPVGFIDTPKYTLYLYDPNDPNSVRPKRQATEKQLQNLAIGRAKQLYNKWYRDWGFIEEDRANVVKCVQEFIQQDDWVILDTETTGLGDAEVIEVAVINGQKETLINTFVRPTIPIPQEATAIHGITDEMVANAPTFSEIYPELKQVLQGKVILIYNDEADRRFLNYCCKLHKLPNLGLKDRTFCLMHWYARWYGDYSSYWRDYKWQPLCGGHRALGDCLTALSRLQKIAADDPTVALPDFLTKSIAD